MNAIPDQTFKTAALCYGDGNRAKAKEICLVIPESCPDFAKARYLLGLISQDEGDHQEAISHLIQANQANPANTQILFQLAVSCNRMDMQTQAIDYYQQLLSINPHQIEGLCNLGNLFQKNNQTLKAIDCYNRAIALNPTIAQIHYNLGVCYQANFQPEKAISSFRTVLRLDNKHAVALNNLGVSLTELGMIGEAISCLRKAQKIDSTYADPLFNLHAILLNPEDLTESIHCLEMALQLEPANQSYRFFLGLLHDYRGDSAIAKRYFEIEQTTKAFQADLMAWQFIKQFQKNLPVIHGHASQVLKYALQHAVVQGLVLEFGVFNGKSIRMIADLVEGPVHGFDSFEGIPEDWNHEKAGSYSTHQALPDVPGNVSLHPGWFHESIPEFIKKESSAIRFMNIDCDLYSSTKVVLSLMAAQVVAGTVIVFDEYISNTSWKEDEHKAFQEVATQHNWAYKLLNFSFMTKQLVVLIESVATFL